MTAPAASIANGAQTGAASARRWLTIALVSVVVAILATAAIRGVYATQSRLAISDSVLAQQLAGPDPALADPDAWIPLTLPNKLCRADCASRYKVYRFEIAVAPFRGAVYLPMYDGAAAVWLNDVKVGQTGSMTDPIADMTYQPALFELSEDLLRPGMNTLDIVVASLVPAGGRLMPPHIAPLDELQPAYGLTSFLTVNVLSVINGIFMVLGFCALLLYVSGDRDRLYLWFALLLVFAGARNLNVLLPEWPATLVTRNWIYLTATLGVLLSTLGFVSRLARRRETQLDVALIAALVPASIAIAFGLSADLWPNWLRANAVIHVVGIVLMPYALVRFLLHARSLPVAAHAAIFGLLSLGLVLILHDIVLARSSQPLVFQLSNLAALPVVLSFCIVLVTRYARHVATVKRHNVELRAAVAAREQELEASYRKASEQERQKTLSDERQRIMRDMHDGVAGRLAIILQQLRRNRADNDSLSEELQRSLQDLRLVFDSLDDEIGVRLDTALEAFREHMQPTADERGVELECEFRDVSNLELGPEKTLQVYRCLQEGIFNALRHAGAGNIRLEVFADERHVHLSLRDNGRGFDMRHGNGRGLINMRQRIESLGGNLDVSTGDGGTTLSFRLPLGNH